MSAPVRYEEGARRLGYLIFVLALAATAALVALGVTGTPWPKWLLGLASIF